MRRLIGIGCASVAIAALGMLGCSSSKSSSTTTSGPITNVPSSTVANTLTASEAVTACEEIFAYIESALKGLGCVGAGRVAALMGGGSDPTATCQITYNTCMQQPAAPDAGTTECSTASAQLSTCTATIAQINQCMADYTSALKSATASVTCATALSDAGTSSTTTPTTPASCTPLQTTCPSLSAVIFGTSSSSPPSENDR